MQPFFHFFINLAGAALAAHRFLEKLIFLDFRQKSLPFPVDKHFFMGYSMYHTYKLIQML